LVDVGSGAEQFLDRDWRGRGGADRQMGEVAEAMNIVTPNHRAALDAAVASSLHLRRDWHGASERGRSMTRR